MKLLPAVLSVLLFTEVGMGFPLFAAPGVSKGVFKRATRYPVDHRIGNNSELIENLSRQIHTDYVNMISGDLFQTILKDVEDYCQAHEIPLSDLVGNRTLTHSIVDGILSSQEVLQGTVVHQTMSSVAKTVSLPKAFDSRKLNWVTPVRDQGSCSSCVAFATAANIESSLLASSKASSVAPVIVSPSDIFFCLGSGDANCNDGWDISVAAADVSSAGYVQEKCFPYHDTQQPCPAKEGCHRRTNIKSTSLFDINDIKHFILKHGAVVTAIVVYEDFYDCCQNDQVYRYRRGALQGGHAIACIGWDDSRNAWLCKNSWSTTWGTNGFFWIAYGECGIMGEVMGYSTK
ncbi:uncharacterized protein BJ171DRAFT_601615 [Polychytrium aggregatum]|uniref:uncharacterized protein n=1 Tax=Polychytrium aggregatum TaxID=110093 RepID=UPI0022FDC97F|nr:uncharacterized protein BJ171DRAFT_601615 [Polychytrium aggregatum]KAI9199697.1 hypothetical protein BJ171DRAFT_601615 [Polychytrium aggregatum]